MKVKLLTLALAMTVAISAWARTTLGIAGEEATSVGIYIKDLRSGRVLAECDSKKALVPASVMKSVTAAAALSLLGEDYIFTTPVYLCGEPSAESDSAWIGNLVIVSSADPTIDSELFDKRTPFAREIADALLRQGIKSISGKIIIEQSLKEPGCIPQWEIDDVAWSYGAGLFGFNFADNKFYLYPATGETKPYVPDLEVTLAADKDGTNLERGVFSNHLFVWGSEITNPKWRVSTTMYDPAMVFTTQLLERLRIAGIEVLDQEVDNGPQRKLVCEHASADLYDILSNMMTESHNLYAEGMLRALAPAGTRKDAIKAELAFLRSLGLAVNYNTIHDGSGLSRTDRLQPFLLSELYEKMAKGPLGKKYASLFPRVGMDGTVKSLLAKTRLKGQLALKSGSMGGVQCFAGYKLDTSGNPTHTVVILVNSFFCQRSEVRSAIEKLLLDTF